MPFDPTTAYEGAYQYIDLVEGVSWERSTDAGTETQTGLKGRWATIDRPDLVSVAAGLGLSTEAAAIAVWEPKPSDVDADDWQPTFNPKPGDVLRRTEEDSEGWLIASVVRSGLRGKWSILADKVIANA